MEEVTTIPNFFNAFPSNNQKENKNRKEAGNVCNNEQRILDSFPFSQLLQFEGDAESNSENTEENILKAEKKANLKFNAIQHLTGQVCNLLFIFYYKVYDDEKLSWQ